MRVVVSSTGAVIDPMDSKVSEVLKEVQLDYESPTLTKFIDETISSIKQAINKIPQDLKVGSDLTPGFIRDVNADKFEFNFKKPAAIEIGGSYSIQALTKPSISIDLFIRLPKECLLEKDYLNHRYHAKRCLYLCIIKKYLNASSRIKTIEWSTFQNEARKPVLLLYPVQELVEIPGFLIRLIPTATSLFSVPKRVPKLNLTRSNVRPLNKGGMVPQATPRYNSSILEDMLLEENAEFVRKTFLGWEELREAQILIKKPAAIEIGGIYSIQALTKPSISIDLFIRLPKECLLEKDYLNHRYHAKRCLYLCIIKKYLNASSRIKTIECSTFQNEARKPVLLLYPVQELVEIPGFLIRLIPTATSLFSVPKRVPKLNLTQSNVRPLNKGGMVPQATPRYNSSILEDMLLEENAEFVRKTFLGWEELREALILIKVWARQRTSIYAHDCLNGFLISVVLSYLATTSGGNHINKSMKTMQIFPSHVGFYCQFKVMGQGSFAAAPLSKQPVKGGKKAISAVVSRSAM